MGRCRHRVYLTIVILHKTPEGFAYNFASLLGARNCLVCHVPNVQQHGRSQVTAFQQVQVDVHVVRSLAASLGLMSRDGGVNVYNTNQVK